MSRLAQDFELLAVSDAALDTALTAANETIGRRQTVSRDTRRDYGRVVDVARIVRRFQKIVTTVMPLALEYPAGGDDVARAAWADRVHGALSQ